MKILIILYSLQYSYGFQQQCDPKTLEKLVNVDHVIGAFIPAHIYKVFTNTYELNVNAIVWASSIIYSINKINADEKLLPDITLGFVIKDTCGRQIIATNFAIELMLDTKYFAPEILIKSLTTSEHCVDGTGLRKLLMGVVGGSSSAISAAISNALSTDYIPQISYSSTSTSLSNKKLYRSFLRTIPSDAYQAAAIAEILNYFNWTYVSAFASDDAYGRIGMEELRHNLKKHKICLAKDMLFNSPTIRKKDEEEIFDHLGKLKNKSHVVILWCQATEASYIVQEASNRGVKGIVWIATETWGSNYFFRTNLKNGTGHVIAIDIYREKMEAFENDFFEGSSGLLCSNPWFLEYLDVELLGGQTCDNFTFYSYALPTVKYQQIMSSVYSLAHGLHKYLNCTEMKCSNKGGILNYQDLYNEILKVDFILPGSNTHIKFDNKGEVRYHTYIYRMADLMKLSANSGDLSEYILIGSWSDRININVSSIKWGPEGQPKSFCSDVCKPGYYKIDGSSECCWNCAKCTENTVTVNPGESKCKPCKSIELANENHTFCQILHNNTLNIKSLTGIFITVLSAIGVVIALFVIVIFIRFWDTPIIKSSSRELSIIQVTSLLVLFCVPIIAYFPVTVYLCIFQTLTFGFCLSTVLAIIVVKTYRLLRIFKGGASKVSRFFQEKYQIVLVYSFVLIQLAASILWYLFKPLKSKIVINKASLSYHVNCGMNNTIIFFIVLCYAFLLALVSGYMAFRARKLPENFNEAHFICFSMFTACILWLVYIPLYFSLEAVSALIAFLLVNYVNALAILLILYAYRLYIVLIHPNMNSPEYFRKNVIKFTKTELNTNDGASITPLMKLEPGNI